MYCGILFLQKSCWPFFTADSSKKDWRVNSLPFAHRRLVSVQCFQLSHHFCVRLRWDLHFAPQSGSLTHFLCMEEFLTFLQDAQYCIHKIALPNIQNGFTDEMASQMPLICTVIYFWCLVSECLVSRWSRSTCMH